MSANRVFQTLCLLGFLAILPSRVLAVDCNGNGVSDDQDIANCDGSAWCGDCNGNLVPDGCEPDCDGDGIIDACETVTDADQDGVDDCADICPLTTPPGACLCPPVGRCCFLNGTFCIDNYPRDACIAQGGTPDCLAGPCHDGCLIGDCDRDGDGDVFDIGGLQICFSASIEDPAYIPPSAECTFYFDYDADEDVDLDDSARSVESITGPRSSSFQTFTGTTAAEINISVQQMDGTNAITVAPGGTVLYEIIGTLSDNVNEGLALFGLDLAFDGGALTPQAVVAPAGMSSFVKPDGITNPAGYGGTMNDLGELIQVGGGQNTIKNTADNAPFPIGEVVTGIGHTPVVLATGSLTAPATTGTYHLVARNVFSNVIKAGETGDPSYATEQVAVGSVTNLAIEVAAVVSLYGVVYEDLNASSQPDIDEGIAGVKVSVGGTADTSDQGGNYEIPDPSLGVVRVDASMNGLTYARRSFTVGIGPNEFNVQLNKNAMDAYYACQSDLACALGLSGIVPIVGTPADALAISLSTCDVGARALAGDALGVLTGSVLVLTDAVHFIGTVGGQEPFFDFIVSAVSCLEGELWEYAATNCGGYASCIWQGLRWLRRSIIGVATHSPVKIFVRDSMGRVLSVDEMAHGVNPLATPGIAFRGPDGQQMVLVFDPIGAYSIEIVGEPEAGAASTFDLELVRQQTNGAQSTQSYFNVPTSNAGKAVLAINEQIGDTLMVDVDGDGQFELELHPDEVTETPAIPATSLWGLIGLSLAVVACGTVILRNRISQEKYV